MPTVCRAAVEIPTAAETIFALLADPAQHARFDATGMVGAVVAGVPLTHVGQVFTMAMSYTDGEQVEFYRSDNHVTALDPPRRIGWATAAEGGGPLGWTWTYDLEPVGAATRVTLTYDWTDTPPEHVSRFGVPLMEEADLSESLQLLAIAVTS